MNEYYRAEKERVAGIHLSVVICTTFAGVIFSLEGIILKWEFWTPPLMLAGVALIWYAHLAQKWTVLYRERLYALYLLAVVFLNGVHESSLAEVSFISSVFMIIVSILENTGYLHCLFIEYLIILLCQVYFLFARRTDGEGINFSNAVLFLIIYFFGTVITYRLSVGYVIKRKLLQDYDRRRNEEQERVNQGMEDFLANISHEFRTPINVVTGMSELLLKDNADDRVRAVQSAGNRLAEQVEDILDYTEINSGRVILSEEKYMITSLVNDLVQEVRSVRKPSVEFIVDLDAAAPRVMAGDARRLKRIINHLLSNAFKFTERGGIYFKLRTKPRDYGVNLDIEVADTGRGMTREEIEKAANKLYQGNGGRDRSTGGIGLGLSVVYGFVYEMGGFVRIESEPGKGTSVRISIPQAVIDDSPCLSVDRSVKRSTVLYLKPEKYSVPQVREFYQTMSENLAAGLHLPLICISALSELKRLLERKEITHLFTAYEEYDEDREYFDRISQNIFVAVTADAGFSPDNEGRILHILKPFYALPVVSLLNSDEEYDSFRLEENIERPYFPGVRALIVDDEMMNLVVASGLFGGYGMITDTAESGQEAVRKYSDNDYEVIFMDHMMPEMDGVEAMKRLRDIGDKTGRRALIIALTANAVSGAREMFMSEGFDGFIAKPVEIREFEGVLKRLLPPDSVKYRREK